MQKKQIWHRYKTNEQSTVSGRKRENIKLLNPSLVLKYFQHKVKHFSTSKIVAKSGQDQILLFLSLHLLLYALYSVSSCEWRGPSPTCQTLKQINLVLRSSKTSVYTRGLANGSHNHCVTSKPKSPMESLPSQCV